jgi:hypothetical protein
VLLVDASPLSRTVGTWLQAKKHPSRRPGASVSHCYARGGMARVTPPDEKRDSRRRPSRLSSTRPRWCVLPTPALPVVVVVVVVAVVVVVVVIAPPAVVAVVTVVTPPVVTALGLVMAVPRPAVDMRAVGERRSATESHENRCRQEGRAGGASQGHTLSRRRVAADAHQRPTRRFRQWLEPPKARRAGTLRRLALGRASLPIWSCSVWGLPCPSPYRLSGALLPHLFTLTGLAQSKDQTRPAVCFLWHWPSTGLEARVPDVIRHTALRSSDFPPPAPRANATPAATARSSCLPLVYLAGHPA